MLKNYEEIIHLSFIPLITLKNICLKPKNLNSLIKKNLIKNHFLHSKVNITKYNGKICTEYNFVPTVSPDFIYLDGPEQYSIVGSINVSI